MGVMKFVYNLNAFLMTKCYAFYQKNLLYGHQIQ